LQFSERFARNDGIMRHSFRTLAACALIAGLAAACSHGDRAASMKIGSKKFPTANNIKMTVLVPGDLQPMSAILRDERNSAVLQVVQGGNTTAKPIEVDHGKCPNPGAVQYRLPPFRGNQYQAVLKGANLAELLDGNHVLAIYSSNGRRRTTYACGDLNPPNALQH